MSTCRSNPSGAARGVVGVSRDSPGLFNRLVRTRCGRAERVCVELRVNRDLVKSSPASAAAEHIQPSLDVTPWDTRSAQLANSSYRHDKR